MGCQCYNTIIIILILALCNMDILGHAVYDTSLLCRNHARNVHWCVCTIIIYKHYFSSKSISLVCSVCTHVHTHLFLWFVYIVDVANQSEFIEVAIEYWCGGFTYSNTHFQYLLHTQNREGEREYPTSVLQLFSNPWSDIYKGTLVALQFVPLFLQLLLQLLQ